MAVKVVTGKVRLSYANLFEARASQEGGEAKYSVSLIIPKKDTATIEAIKKAIDEVIQAEKAAKFGGKDKGLKYPLRDGDMEKDDPAYEGCMFINASSKQRPIILNEDKQPVIDAREVYSGCFGRASINLYAFNSNGNKGIAAGLNAIQKVADGDSLGGAYTESAAADDFTDDIL